ncbi:putative reverse transcriptase domain-containing protein [Tanacetum coccineum]
MVNARHKEVLKGSTSKEVGPSANEADQDDNDYGSSSISEDLNFRGFSKEETQVLSKMISRRVGKAIKNRYVLTNDYTRWLSAVEGTFGTSSCKEKNKVNFASNFLRDSSKMWWNGKVCKMGEEWIGSCTWKEFKELFNAEYAPAEEVDKIQEEFQTLMQTNEKVNELWNKFNDLIPYCPEYHGNEKLKVERFQRMLRDDIRENKKAKETKRKLEFRARDVKKPKHDHGVERWKSKPKQPSKKSAIKLILESVGQIFQSNECPNLKAIEANPFKSIKEEKVEKAVVPNSKARVYVMSAEEDKLVHDVVTSTILVNYIPARVLYDSGVSFSFVYYEFSINLSARPNKLPFPLEVEITDSKVIVVSNVYRDVEIEIDDSIFRIDLIPIIQKLVRVANPQGREIIIYGDKRKGNFKLCSVMKARKYLSHGCYASIAHVIDTSFEKKSAKDVPIVNEFLDVFLEDLSGITPERQVEFRIDLISGATPIAKTPYRLAPSEMKELMSQLQELLDKGFYSP